MTTDPRNGILGRDTTWSFAMAWSDFLEIAYVPPDIAPAYKKLELRMQNNGYGALADDIRLIASTLSREQIETLLAMLYHPLTRPYTTKLLLENYHDSKT